MEPTITITGILAENLQRMVAQYKEASKAYYDALCGHDLLYGDKRDTRDLTAVQLSDYLGWVLSHEVTVR